MAAGYVERGKPEAVNYCWNESVVLWIERMDAVSVPFDPEPFDALKIDNPSISNLLFELGV